ncbi:MAG: tRNA uridine-5-carboxymethylaminomethyl(34) synthesis GTPase MnmE [Clostridia bacterium]|nr:tRNA uridine-5-carboxymethylaminomethyl(34) synthesis GTPase MnmE [Clostridia bacterium]
MKILDTIAAVSTPRGKGGVAMIRISGGNAVEISSRVFFPKSGKNLTDIAANTAFYGDIKSREAGGRLVTIDDGVAVIYRAPHSFTGEDTVEICCHGGILVTESVLSACLAAGCRQAEAGEFTRRAFISGRLGLSEAEDLGALLEAKTHGQMLLSRNGLDGHLRDEIEDIYISLREILASVYAKIDFPDEDLASVGEAEMLRGVERTKERLLALERTYKTGRAVREGVKTVICGRTNAGKSSIYNRIVGREAAIVTDVEGTTRDILENTAELGGITVLLCDTAGLRETDDVVENIGIGRSRAAIAEAELVLAVFDASSALGEEDKGLIEELKKRGDVVAILNKSDCDNICADTVKQIEENMQRRVKLSAKTGVGFSELEKAVRDIFDADGIDLREDAVITNARQRAAVLWAIEGLDLAAGGLRSGLTVDLCGTDIEYAMSALAEIEGREVTEDIVSDIFAHFCVGK